MATYLGKNRVGLTLGYGQGVTDCKVEGETLSIPVNVQTVKEVVKRDSNVLPFYLDILFENPMENGVAKESIEIFNKFQEEEFAWIRFKLSMDTVFSKLRNELESGNYYLFPYVKRKGRWEPLMSVTDFLSRVGNPSFSDTFGKMRITDIDDMQFSTAKLLGALIADKENSLTEIDTTLPDFSVFSTQKDTQDWLQSGDTHFLWKSDGNAHTMTFYLNNATAKPTLEELENYKAMAPCYRFDTIGKIRTEVEEYRYMYEKKPPVFNDKKMLAYKDYHSIAFVGFSKSLQDDIRTANRSNPHSILGRSRMIFRTVKPSPNPLVALGFTVRFAIRKITPNEESETGYDTIRTPLSGKALMGRLYGGYKTTYSDGGDLDWFEEDTYFVYSYLRNWVE